MVSNQQPIAFSTVIFLFTRGENSVGIFCRRSTSITEYASKRNSTFCLPFAFCLRRKLKNSAPKPGKAIKLRCQLGWLVEGSQGSWLGEGRGITSCASHTIRARPTPSALPHFPHQLASTPRPAWNIYVTRSKSLKSKSESQAQRAGQCQRGVGLKIPARWAGTWGWIIASRHWLRLVSLQISWPIANDNANSSNNTATRQWSNSNMTRRRHGKRLS